MARLFSVETPAMGADGSADYVRSFESIRSLPTERRKARTTPQAGGNHWAISFQSRTRAVHDRYPMRETHIDRREGRDALAVEATDATHGAKTSKRHCKPTSQGAKGQVA